MFLVSRRHILGLHELLKHPRTVIRVLTVVLFIHGQNQSVFSSRRASTAGILTQKIGYVFPVCFSVGCEFFLTHKMFGSFFPCREPCSLFVFGAVVFPMSFVGCGFQFRFGPLWIANSWVEFSLSVHAGSCSSPLLGLCELPLVTRRNCVCCWLNFPVLGLWTVVILHGVLWLLIYPGLGAVVELFWPR